MRRRGLRSALLLGVLGVGAVWAVRSGLLDSVLERLLGVHGAPRDSSGEVPLM